MNQVDEQRAYEQAQTEELLTRAKRELEQVNAATPVDETQKAALEATITSLTQHSDSLRKIVLEPEENEELPLSVENPE